MSSTYISIPCAQNMSKLSFFYYADCFGSTASLLLGCPHLRRNSWKVNRSRHFLAQLFSHLWHCSSISYLFYFFQTGTSWALLQFNLLHNSRECAVRLLGWMLYLLSASSKTSVPFLEPLGFKNTNVDQSFKQVPSKNLEIVFKEGLIQKT